MELYKAEIGFLIVCRLLILKLEGFQSMRADIYGRGRTGRVLEGSKACVRMVQMSWQGRGPLSNITNDS
jgi:hypothetical protein